MVGEIYATKTAKIGNKKENETLLYLFELVAQRHPVITKKNRRIPLFDYDKNAMIRKNTFRFVAREATKFIRKQNIENIDPDQNIGRYASVRQINRLINSNSPYTTAHAVTIVITLLRLLQLDDPLPKEPDYSSERVCSPDYSPEKICPQDNGYNCAKVYLGKHFDDIICNIISGLGNFALGTRYIAEYIVDTSDCLDVLVCPTAYAAIRILRTQGQKKPILQISPQDLPCIPTR